MTAPGVSGHIETLASLQARMAAPVLKEAGMTLTTFQLLSHVASHPGPVRQAVLVEEMGLAAATLSESVKDHVEKGLLEQVGDPEDKRSKRVSLTEKGKSALTRVAHRLKGIDALYVEALGSKGASALFQALEKAIKGIEAIAAKTEGG